MAKLIFDCLLILVASAIGYGICLSVNNKHIANQIVLVAGMMLLLVLMRDLTPIINKWGARINSWQNTADNIANLGRGSWLMPMKGEITQPYKGEDHHGIDIGAPLETPVKATKDGEVTSVRWSDVYGNMVIVDHGNGFESLYAHLQGISVEQGYQVIAGKQIGTCGNTGNSNGPHLHFEIRHNGITGDPMNYLRS